MLPEYNKAEEFPPLAITTYNSFYGTYGERTPEGFIKFVKMFQHFYKGVKLEPNFHEKSFEDGVRMSFLILDKYIKTHEENRKNTDAYRAEKDAKLKAFAEILQDLLPEPDVRCNCSCCDRR